MNFRQSFLELFIAACLLICFASVCLGQEDTYDPYAADDDFWNPYYDDYDEYNDYVDNFIMDDCIVDENGVSNLTGVACDVIVSGNDLITKYSGGGVAGKYKYTGCANGRPMYAREDNQMFLIYSDYWGDWDFSNTSSLTDLSVLAYGGEGYGETRPEEIAEHGWYVLQLLTDSIDSTNDFIAAEELSVKCDDDFIAALADSKAPTCTDGIMNGDEIGIDCGGSKCVDCETLEEIRNNNLATLRKKIENEYQADQAAAQRSKIAQGVVVVMAMIGFGLVCGGPLLYLVKMMKAQRQGTMYRGVEMSAQRKAGPRRG